MKLTDIKGIGPKVYNILKEKGINDLKSLIYTFPKNYTEYKLSGFSYTDNFNVKAVIIDEIKTQKLKVGTKISFDCLIEDLRYTCVAFNMTYLDKAFKIGSEVVIVGSYSNEFKQIVVNKIFEESKYQEGIIPEYNIEGISNPAFKKMVLEALTYFEPKTNIIPDEYFIKKSLPVGKDLLYKIHSPKNMQECLNARKSLKYYEIMSFSIKLAIIRKNMSLLRKEPKNYDLDSIKAFIELGIKFELTEDQKKAVNDIFKYLKSNIPLNMLLEGDVGCGKTIVSILATYATKTSGEQTLVMVPTEALAKQHYNSFKTLLEPFNVNVSLLTSSTSLKDRKDILSKLTSGEMDVVIGTQSLLSDEVVFKKLGFVVCDEQHKFGVDQRKKIREKGNNPDTLYMTATPIPRTLALTIFNDMTLETIKSSPKNRKKIMTYLHTYKDYLKVLKFVKSEIEDGRQAYFVAPCIDDNIESSMISVLRIKEDLDKYYSGLRIGLLHGKLTQKEKNDVLESFMKKEIDILVSTTVIEVGIDNPNASVMVIIDANHFGLANIHQLRGRVGRGSFDGYCFLMVEKKEYMERLKILEETQDGFLISEEDLKDRGPGDFLGTEQSGMLKFNYANIFKDMDLFIEAKKDANELIKDKLIFEYYENRLYSDKFD